MVPNVLYEELKRVAGDGKTIIYRKAGQLVGLDIESKRDRDQLMAFLEEVNRLEHEAGRPLLSAVVVAYIQQVPGAGLLAKTRRPFGQGGCPFHRSCDRVIDFPLSEKAPIQIYGSPHDR